jgi:hypothetical protein
MRSITSLLVLSALFSSSFGMNGSLKSRLAGKNLAQLEVEDVSANMPPADYYNTTTDCELAPLPALVLDCPCEITQIKPDISGAS